MIVKQAGRLAAAALALAWASEAAAVPASTAPAPAVAVAGGSVDVDLTGWASFGGFGSAKNSKMFFALAPGMQVTGFEYFDVAFETFGGSWLRELTLSVNNIDGSEFMDWSPSLVEDPGSFGPGSGRWGGTAGGAGTFGSGAPFVVADGVMWVTVYEGFDDPDGDNGATIDALVSSGTLRVYFAAAAVPEPGSYALMALGLLAVGGLARRPSGRR